ncbi:hypothetical protein BofuT4_uP135450.1 [Botrytis cinerea T4]|uniref:Uncharacterized protein n=1 Tax=Botryotinia fuckeliana (strain T4) TaxID=999810 RepID=G2YPF2_BOTF4|nr:hypothetical protein BofuT4_uP135450.1 [Botrytis cinerea T4]
MHARAQMKSETFKANRGPKISAARLLTLAVTNPKALEFVLLSNSKYTVAYTIAMVRLGVDVISSKLFKWQHPEHDAKAFKRFQRAR